MTHDEKREAAQKAAAGILLAELTLDPNRRWDIAGTIADAILALTPPPATGTGKHAFGEQQKGDRYICGHCKMEVHAPLGNPEDIDVPCTYDPAVSPPATSEIGAEDTATEAIKATGLLSGDEARDAARAVIGAIGADYRRGLEDAARHLTAKAREMRGDNPSPTADMMARIFEEQATAIRSLSAQPDTCGYMEWADEGEKGDA